jgi:chromosome segregation ATPase
MLINQERKQAEEFAAKMEHICHTTVLFVGWDEHMSFIRAAYRMYHELWSYHQLATIDQLHEKLKGEIQEHKDRIAEMSRIASVRDEGMSQPEKQRVKDHKEIQGLKKELDGWRKESIAQKKRIQELENMLESERAEIKELEKSLKRYAELEAA